MTESIRRQLVVPPYVSAIHMAVGLGMVAVGIMLVAASSSRTVPALAPEVELSDVSSQAPIEAPRTAVAANEAPAPIPNEIKLVFRAAGAPYMQLDGIERNKAGALQWPRHGKVRLVHDDGVEIAIAPVSTEDVPSEHRSWAGKQVVVDNACRATVTGFAVVSRLTGYPPTWVEKDQWDAASVMQLGDQMLAAKLDGCNGIFARDAALAPVVVPEPIRDDRLARTARSALIASTAGTEMKRRWEKYKEPWEGLPSQWWEYPGLELDTKVLRHPSTGATLVTVHAHAGFVCGGPDINLWGLYTVDADGALAPVHETRLQYLDEIARIIDIEGDGEIELIGLPWPGNAVVIAGPDGKEHERLQVQLYGSPC